MLEDSDLDLQDDFDQEPAENIPEQWRGYLRTKRLKFDHDCNENVNFLRQIRERALEIQRRTGEQFVVNPPINRYDSKAIEPYPITRQVFQHLNRFFFQPEDSSLSHLFDGVCIYVNGYTKPTAAELHLLMGFTGGRYTQVYDTYRTTHVIGTIVSGAISERAKKTAVIPEWIMDSLEAGRMLPLQEYLLFKQRNIIKEMFSRAPKIEQVPVTDPEPMIVDHVQQPPPPPPPSSSTAGEKRKRKNVTKTDGRKQLRIDTMFKQEEKRAADPKKLAMDLYLGRRGCRRANICGRIKPDQVCEILDEWIGTFSSLTDMDVTYVIRYVLSLVDECQWKTLRRILENMRQAIDRCPTDTEAQWRMFFGQTIHDLLKQESSLPEGFLSDGLFEFDR